MYYGMRFLQNYLPKIKWMNRLTVEFGTFAEVFTGAKNEMASEGNL